MSSLELKTENEELQKYIDNFTDDGMKNTDTLCKR